MMTDEGSLSSILNSVNVAMVTKVGDHLKRLGPNMTMIENQ